MSYLKTPHSGKKLVDTRNLHTLFPFFGPENMYTPKNFLLQTDFYESNKVLIPEQNSQSANNVSQMSVREDCRLQL